jgi:hypothetical protein
MLSILQNFTINTQPPELNMRLFVPNQFTGVYYGNRSSFDAISKKPYIYEVHMRHTLTS